MKRTILTVVLSILLSSCGEVPGWRVEMAVSKCKEHNGVNYLTIPKAKNFSYAVCGDGTRVIIGINK